MSHELIGMWIGQVLGGFGSYVYLIKIPLEYSCDKYSNLIGPGSNLAVHFDFFLFFPCRIFLSVDRSRLH